MRDRAQALIAAFDARPAPQTLSDMLCAARLLMVLDRLLTQLWKMPADKAVGRCATAEAEPAPETDIALPLNRQQRRALEARNKTVRGPSDTLKTLRRSLDPVMPYVTGWSP